ncbi:MAG: hypothetical protein LBE08_04150 [Bifidobacteriaceae bacterium]|nr:hypothetical protein [Bifidobacteriaceae bacterium]
MKLLDELFDQAEDQGLVIEVDLDAPAYLHDAVHRHRAKARTPAPQGGGTAQGRLCVLGEIRPLATGDWFVLDLAGGRTLEAPRVAATELASAGAQLHSVVWLEGGEALAVGRATKTPEAVGPLFEVLGAARGLFEPGRAASSIDFLTWANAEVAVRANSSAVAGALAGRMGELETVATSYPELVERLAESQEQTLAAKERIIEISGMLVFRIERKIRYLARRLVRRGTPPQESK